MDDLVSLTCPNCGGKLVETNSAGAYACSHCGTDYRVHNAPELQKMEASLEQMQARLEKVADQSSKTAAVVSVPGLIAELEYTDRNLQGRVRVILTGILVFMMGLFFSKVLIFTSESGWLRYLPGGLMAAGLLAISISLLTMVSLLSRRGQIQTELRRARKNVR